LLWHTEVNGNYTFTNNYQFNPHYTLGAYYSSAPTSGSRGSGNNYWASVNTRLQYTYTQYGRGGNSSNGTNFNGTNGTGNTSVNQASVGFFSSF